MYCLRQTSIPLISIPSSVHGEWYTLSLEDAQLIPLQMSSWEFFGTSSRQSSFRQTFTPLKNFVFSRVELKYLHSKVAHALVRIFFTIANNPNESRHLPRQKGQRKEWEKYYYQLCSVMRLSKVIFFFWDFSVSKNQMFNMAFFLCYLLGW